MDYGHTPGIGRFAVTSAADGVTVTSMPAPHAGSSGLVVRLRLIVSVAGEPMPSTLGALPSDGVLRAVVGNPQVDLARP